VIIATIPSIAPNAGITRNAKMLIGTEFPNSPMHPTGHMPTQQPTADQPDFLANLGQKTE
jgi:hypothetical protein